MLQVNEKPSSAAGYSGFSSYCQTCPKLAKPKLKIIAFCLPIFNFIAIFCIIIFLVTYVTLKPSCATSHTEEETEPSEDTSVQNPSQDHKVTDNNNITGNKLRVVTRREWLAQPPIEQGDKLKHPVPYVVILHTATENCSSPDECTFFVRYTQTFHIESNGWWDIGYNFLIGGDGNVYEGRGWDTVGTFAYGYNNKAIGIAFIGTFISTLPPPKQILAGQLLIAEGVKLGKISPDYKLLAHRQLSATESPGKAFYEDIQKWPHWAEKP